MWGYCSTANVLPHEKLYWVLVPRKECSYVNILLLEKKKIYIHTHLYKN